MLGVTRGKEYSCTPHRCLRDPVGVTFRFPPTNPRFFLAFHPYHYLAAQRESGGRRRAPVKTFHGNVRARSPLKIRNSSPRNVSQLLPLPPPLPLENAFPELLNNRTSPRMASFSRDSNGIYFRAWKEGRRVEKKGRREEKKGKKKKELDSVGGRKKWDGKVSRSVSSEFGSRESSSLQESGMAAVERG